MRNVEFLHNEVLIHHRDTESAEVRREIGMQTSNSERIGLLEFPQENKAKAFEEMRNPRVELSGTLGFREKAEAVVFKEILRSLDLFGFFWVKPKTNTKQIIERL